MELKVVSYNIQSGRTNEETSRRSYDFSAEVIKDLDPDIIGLNEVGKQASAGFPPVEMTEEAAEYLGNKLGMYWYFAKATEFRGYGYGNALLSKYPIKSARTVIIPDPPRTEEGYYETRSVLVAELDVAGGITMMTSHFGLMEAEKRNAVDTVVSLIEEIKTPILFMGDLNMTPGDEKLQPIFRRLHDTADGAGRPVTIPSHLPEEDKHCIKIDYIFTSEHFKTKEIGTYRSLASDHLPYIAHLEI